MVQKKKGINKNVQLYLVRTCIASSNRIENRCSKKSSRLTGKNLTECLECAVTNKQIRVREVKTKTKNNTKNHHKLFAAVASGWKKRFSAYNFFSFIFISFTIFSIILLKQLETIFMQPNENKNEKKSLLFYVFMT